MYLLIRCIISRPKTYSDYNNLWTYPVVVISAVKNKSTPQIKQDFIEYNERTFECIYYSGIPNGSKKSKYFQSIDDFA